MSGVWRAVGTRFPRARELFFGYMRDVAHTGALLAVLDTPQPSSSGEGAVFCLHSLRGVLLDSSCLTGHPAALVPGRSHRRMSRR